MSYKNNRSNKPMNPEFSHDNGKYLVFSYSSKGGEATPVRIEVEETQEILEQVSVAVEYLTADFWGNVKVWAKGMAKTSLRVNGLDDLEKFGTITSEEYIMLRMKAEGKTVAQVKKGYKKELETFEASKEQAASIETALGGAVITYHAPDVDPLDEYLTGLGFAARKTDKGTSYKLGSTTIGRAHSGKNAGKWMRRVSGQIVMLGNDEELQTLINPPAKAM